MIDDILSSVCPDSKVGTVPCGGACGDDVFSSLVGPAGNECGRVRIEHKENVR